MPYVRSKEDAEFVVAEAAKRGVVAEVRDDQHVIVSITKSFDKSRVWIDGFHAGMYAERDRAIEVARSALSAAGEEG